MERLILFDIDGTLTRTQAGYLPFNEAILTIFGVAGDIRTVIPDGNTDPRIVQEIFLAANRRLQVGLTQWRAFALELERCYIEAVRLGRTMIRPLPGAADLLRLLSSNGFGCSVVTGNFEPIAHVKLSSAGLDGYLCRGAYGSDSPHRPDLPVIARRRYELASTRSVPAEQCIIIGDTPKDLEAARQNGMKCLLVGTGRTPVEELTLFEPDACLRDLSDTDEVVRTLERLY